MNVNIPTILFGSLRRRLAMLLLTALCLSAALAGSFDVVRERIVYQTRHRELIAQGTAFWKNAEGKTSDVVLKNFFQHTGIMTFLLFEHRLVAGDQTFWHSHPDIFAQGFEIPDMPLQVQGKYYEVVGLSVGEHRSLFLVRDVTRQVEDWKQYRKKFVLLGGVLFFILACGVLWTLRYTLRPLSTVTEELKALASTPVAPAPAAASSALKPARSARRDRKNPSTAYGHLRSFLNPGKDEVTKLLQVLREFLRWRKKLDDLAGLKREMRIASSMQQSLSPLPLAKRKEFSLAAYMQPARQVGGDLYDFFYLPDGRLTMALVDVSGKGASAAFFLTGVRAFLRSAAKNDPQPKKVLSFVNQALCENNPQQYFASVFYCLYQPESGVLVYAIGGSPPPLLFSQEQEAFFMKVPTGVALGVLPEAVFREETRVLRTREAFLAYSDGANEAMNGQGDMFGESRLMQTLTQSMENRSDARQGLMQLRDAIASFAEEAPQSDDLTLLLLRRS